jgi:hypothetical protein
VDLRRDNDDGGTTDSNADSFYGDFDLSPAFGAWVRHAFSMPTRERKSLLQILWSRLKREPLPQPAKALAPRPFQAISIYCGVKSCAIARRFRDHRFLARDAPQLPLSGCTMAGACQCRYLKHKDRRAERRRFVDFASIRRDLGQERRQRVGRRDTDSHS